MKSWIEIAANLAQQNCPAIMVSVASTVGSTPREVGAKMIISKSEIFGSIGGGNLEYRTTQIGRDQLSNSAINRQELKCFPLGASLGQCCGGLVNLLFEPLSSSADFLKHLAEFNSSQKPWVRIVGLTERQQFLLLNENSQLGNIDVQDIVDKAKSLISQKLGMSEIYRANSGDDYFIEVNRKTDAELYLFGAGHVAKALVRVIEQLPFQVHWIDEREDQFPQLLPHNVNIICTDTPEVEVSQAKSASYFLVMTHDHNLDQRLVEKVLKRDDFHYLGLIGSKAKRRNFETRMQRRGIDSNNFHKMTCPIGLGQVRSKRPEMIAISVAAELAAIYDQMQHQHTQQGKNKVSNHVKELPLSNKVGALK